MPGELMIQLRQTYETTYVRGSVTSLERTIQQYRETIEHAKRVSSTSVDELAEGLTWIVNASMELGDIQTAIDVAREAIALDPAPFYKAICYTNAAAALCLQGHRTEAKHMAHLGLHFAKQTENSRVIHTCEQNLFAIQSEGPVSITDEYHQDQNQLPTG